MLAMSRPEHWRSDSAGDSVVVLDIPASLSRHRDFDIDETLIVCVPEDGIQAWQELNLEVDGRKQWSRPIFSSCQGQTDGLDYHCRIHLQAERALRVRALAFTRGAWVSSLFIEAKE